MIDFIITLEGRPLTSSEFSRLPWPSSSSSSVLRVKSVSSEPFPESQVSNDSVSDSTTITRSQIIFEFNLSLLSRVKI